MTSDAIWKVQPGNADEVSDGGYPRTQVPAECVDEHQPE